ncbi:MAG: poly-gamma-glutamate system protein [Acholeplasmataceae bacterium]
MKTRRLLFLFSFLVVAFIAIESLEHERKTDYYDQQIAAANLMVDALEAIKKERIERDIEIDKDLDPAETGIIGVPWPDYDEPSISTTLGSLEAKRLSTDPNFAALIVGYFHELDMEAGDGVAINFSGSFPALNVAVLCAVETMDLEPFIASSLGSSTYGANHIDFTYVDMEEILYEQRILSHRTAVLSLGGANDQLLEEDDEDFRDDLLERYRSRGYATIDEDDLGKNIVTRYRTYSEELRTISAFVNVGGNSVGFGRHQTTYPNGLTRRMSVSVVDDSGLIERFLRDDVPVIHLLNIEDLARRQGMDTSSEDNKRIGTGSFYRETEHSLPAIILTVACFFGVIGYDRYQRKKEAIASD